MLWNDATRQFVMWVHVDDANYETAKVGVAMSPRATGPFTYRGGFRPHGQQARDLTLFQARGVRWLVTCPQRVPTDACPLQR